MTLAYWCVLAAILLPYAFTGFAKFQGGFGLNENKNPREFLEKLSGARKRAGVESGAPRGQRCHTGTNVLSRFLPCPEPTT